MALIVNWSPQAKEDLQNIITRMQEAADEAQLKNFIRFLDKKIELIAAMPEMFPPSRLKHGLRRCVVTRYNTLYYQVKNEEIEYEEVEIIALLNNISQEV